MERIEIAALSKIADILSDNNKSPIIPEVDVWKKVFNNAESVSYTHLDVYKRQVQERAWQGRAVDAEPVFCGSDQYAFCRCHG